MLSFMLNFSADSGTEVNLNKIEVSVFGLTLSCCFTPIGLGNWVSLRIFRTCWWRETFPVSLSAFQPIARHSMNWTVSYLNLRYCNIQTLARMACTGLLKCFHLIGCDDNGTWGMAEWSDDACWQEGLLSLVSLCNGAMGWTCTTHIHRWTLCWCHSGQVRWRLFSQTLQFLYRAEWS